jgi:hypothetical protein
MVLNIDSLRVFVRAMLRLAVATSLLLGSVPACAATKYWTGAVDRNWSTPGNWVGGVAPINGDDLFFWARYFTAANLETRNDVPGLALNSLSIASAHTKFVFEGQPLSVVNGVSNFDSPHVTWRIPITLLSAQQFSLSGRVEIDAPIDLNNEVLTLKCRELFIRGAKSFTGSGAVLLEDCAMSVTAPGDFTGTLDVNRSEAHLSADLPNAEVTTSSGRLTSAGRTRSIRASSATLGPGHTDFCCPAIHTVGTLATEDLLMTSGVMVFSAASSYSPLVPDVHDRIRVSRTVTLAANPQLSVAFAPHTPKLGDTYLLVENAGTDAVSGTFARLPEGGSFGGGPTGDVRFAVSYKAGDGNDVAMTAREVVKVTLRAESPTVPALSAHVVHAHVESTDPKRGGGRVFFATSRGYGIPAEVDSDGNATATLRVEEPGTFSVWAVYSIDAYSAYASAIELTTSAPIPMSGAAQLTMFAVVLAILGWTVLNRS